MSAGYQTSENFPPMREGTKKFRLITKNARRETHAGGVVNQKSDARRAAGKQAGSAEHHHTQRDKQSTL